MNKDKKGLALMIGIGSPDAKAMKSEMHSMPIPLSVLSTNDGKENVEPEIGDEVDFTATGNISEIIGGNAIVTVNKINGQEYGANEKKAEEQPAEPMEKDEESQLREMAEQEDQNANL